MVRCHVKGCHRSQAKDKNHHFFSEPANLMIRKQWREFCKIEGISKDVRICSDHFHETCFRKKTPPRPLLVPGAVPTIPPIHQKPQKIQHSTVLRHIKAIEQNDSVKYNQLTLESNDPKKLNEDVIEFMRPALPHECLHNSKTIIVDIEKATESTPATVHIQTNSRIRVVMSGRKCNCQKMKILTKNISY